MSVKQVVMALDQLLNTFLGGYAQERLSSRCWRLKDCEPYTRGQKTIDWVALHVFGQVEHCKGSYEQQLAQAYSPAEYQNKKIEVP